MTVATAATLGDVLDRATARLTAAGVESARVEAEWLLAGVLERTVEPREGKPPGPLGKEGRRRDRHDAAPSLRCWSSALSASTISSRSPSMIAGSR